MDFRETLTNGGLVGAVSALGAAIAPLFSVPAVSGAALAGAFGLAGILIRIGFEYWKITRRDREMLRRYRRTLERHGLEISDTEE